MKAFVLHGINDLRYENRPVPELQPGWALVQVLAAGICSSDIPRIFQDGAHRFPIIPGHEFCGIVRAVADKDDETWIGKRVGIFPLIPCKQCLPCLAGRYELCTHYDYLGSRRDGAFAEYAAVPVWNLISLPDTVSDEQGALLEPSAVALHAVKRVGIQAGDRVCVIGTGAVGLLAGQWANLHGASAVFIKGRNNEKEALAKECRLSWLKDTHLLFDCVIEAVGTKEAVRESLALAEPGGKVLLLGNPDGDILLSKVEYWSVLRKQLTLIGSWNSSFKNKDDDWVETVSAMKYGQLFTDPLITCTLPLDSLLEGLAIMRNKIMPYERIILTSRSA